MPINSLATYRYTCALAQPLCDPVVLLHGWGSNSHSWQLLIPELQKIAHVIAIDLPGFGASPAIDNFTAEAVLELIHAQLPERAVLIGWSLGGMLAVQLAARYPQKISQLVTLAANVKFVADAGFDAAMAPSVNQQFNNSFEQSPEITLKLFSGLMVRGDANERALLKQMRALSVLPSFNRNWLQALELLRELDNRAVFSSLRQPGLHVFGEADALVPASAAQVVAGFNPSQIIQVLPATAHAVHWSQPALIAHMVTTFLSGKTAPLLDKKRIAKSFSKAAATYDSAAELQRQVGTALLEKMHIDTRADVVVDLGCGTGYFSAALQEKFPQAHLIGVDLAEGMLRYASARAAPNVTWLCGDAEQLPFADNSVDVIFSSLALQWCENLYPLFVELQRILKPDGVLIFSTLGPQTLHELKSAWQQVDDYVHVNRFHEQEHLYKALARAQLLINHFERKALVLGFATLTDLTRDLKALGAHNINQGQAQGLHSRKKIEAFKVAYEQYRDNNQLPATYDVFYITATKAG